MSLQLDIYLNQLAQGVKPLAAGEQWFSQLSDEAQVETLERLAGFALQAGAVGADVDAAVVRSGLKTGYTPCRVLSAHTKDLQKPSSALRVALLKMIALPANERSKSFLLLIALFWVADQRRRTRNFDPVNHWWHRDLSDDRVVADILARNGAPSSRRLRFLLSEFVSWANQLGTASRQEAVRVAVTIGEVTSNPSARLDIDAAAKIGRVTFWESGDYHAEIVAYNSGEMIYSNYGVAVLGESLGQCFQSFLQRFGISV